MEKGTFEFKKKESLLNGNKAVLVPLVFILSIANYIIRNVDFADCRIKFWLYSIRPKVIKKNRELKEKYKIEWETHINLMEKENARSNDSIIK